MNTLIGDVVIDDLDRGTREKLSTVFSEAEDGLDGKLVGIVHCIWIESLKYYMISSLNS